MMTEHLTILSDGKHFSVVFIHNRVTKIVPMLSFDEMIGLVIKLTIPFCDNEPIFMPEQLFLDAPNADLSRPRDRAD